MARPGVYESLVLTAARLVTRSQFPEDNLRGAWRGASSPRGCEDPPRLHRTPVLAGRQIDLVTGDHIQGLGSSPAAQAGYPLVGVPAGFSHDLPVGLIFGGLAFSEARLIALAYAFEQAHTVRIGPRFRSPT